MRKRSLCQQCAEERPPPTHLILTLTLSLTPTLNLTLTLTLSLSLSLTLTLFEVFRLGAAYGYSDWLVLDLTVVRGLAYYTGIVFEGFDRSGELRATPSPSPTPYPLP